MKKLKIIFASIMVMIMGLSLTAFAATYEGKGYRYGVGYNVLGEGDYSKFYAIGTNSIAFTTLTNTSSGTKKLSVQVKEYTKGEGWTQSKAREQNCAYDVKVATADVNRNMYNANVYYFHTGLCSEVNYNRRYEDFTYMAMQYNDES